MPVIVIVRVILVVLMVVPVIVVVLVLGGAVRMAHASRMAG